jgi:hypothetical protein
VDPAAAGAARQEQPPLLDSVALEGVYSPLSHHDLLKLLISAPI